MYKNKFQKYQRPKLNGKDLKKKRRTKYMGNFYSFWSIFLLI